MSEAVVNVTAPDIVRDILDSIIRDIVQKDPASIASSFVDCIVNKAVPLPLSPIANERIKESVANVATLGAANKTVVTAEIHNEPGVLKSVNKENELVRTEAVLVTVNVKLLSEWKVAHLQRRSYAKLHRCIAMYWDEYAAGKRSAARLLSACTHACKHV